MALYSPFLPPTTLVVGDMFPMLLALVLQILISLVQERAHHIATVRDANVIVIRRLHGRTRRPQVAVSVSARSPPETP